MFFTAGFPECDPLSPAEFLHELPSAIPAIPADVIVKNFLLFIVEEFIDLSEALYTVVRQGGKFYGIPFTSGTDRFAIYLKGFFECSAFSIYEKGFKRVLQEF